MKSEATHLAYTVRGVDNEAINGTEFDQEREMTPKKSLSVNRDH